MTENTPKLPSKPLIGVQPADAQESPRLPSRPLVMPSKPIIQPEPIVETLEESEPSEPLMEESAVEVKKDSQETNYGYTVNPKNGLLIVPDLENVALPKPALPKNPREIPNVDSDVDTVIIGEIKSFGEAKEALPETIEITDWDDDSDDPSFGLGAEKEQEEPVKKVKLGKGFNITDRDIIMMKFLARYRYAYVDQLARLVNAEAKDIRVRLKKLESEGLIRSEAIKAGQNIYLTRKAGNAIIDVDFSEIKKGQVSFITIAHTIGLGNLGVELEMATGGKNILGEDDFPRVGRYYMGVRDPYSEPTELGEMTVTEREIRRGNRLFRGDKTTEDMRLLAEAAFNDPTGPELLEGNEGLFVVYGKGKDGEHVPDLVISRPRGENGEVHHIAIELELTPKNNSEWNRILRWYRDHGFLYEKIYYFTHKRTLADALKKAAINTGMEDRVIIRKYVPQNNRGPFWG
jgi:DNA-binding Lrp family transcriptional regulator